MIADSAYSAPDYLHNKQAFVSKKKPRKQSQYEPHVYIIRLVSQDKLYIGTRFAKGCLMDDLGSRYFTSSKSVKSVWKQSPEEISIERKIPCASNHDAIILEGLMISWFDAVYSEGFLNIAYGGVVFSDAVDSHTPEARRKRSESLSGEKHFMYGKNHSPESRLKMSGKRPWAKKTEEQRKRMSAAMKGLRKSEEHKKNLSESKRRFHAENPGAVSGEKNGMFGKKQPTKQCKHCGEHASSANFFNYHGKRCAKNPNSIGYNKKQCPHCLRHLDAGNYAQHHGDRCKMKKQALLHQGDQKPGGQYFFEFVLN